MASGEGADPRASLRRFRAANNGAGGKIRPAWTVGDDSGDEEEGSLTFQSVEKRKRFRRRGVAQARQVPDEGGFPFPPPPPPPPSMTRTGVDGSGTATADGPGATGDTSWSASGRIPRPTSLMDSITASLSDGASSTTVSVPSATSDIDSDDDDSDDDDDDDDSEDESTTLKPTQRPSRASGTLGASQTAFDPLPASNTASSPDTDATASPARVAQQKHHQKVETALIVVGCVAGLVCIGIGIWFIIRRHLRKNKDPLSEESSSHSRLRRFKLPFAGRDRVWEQIGDETLYGNEKEMGMSGNDLLAYLPERPVKVQTPTPRVGVARVDEKGFYVNNNSSEIGVEELEQPYSPTETSLSSAFGNGTYVPPTPLHPPPRVQIQPPSSDSYPTRRDTIYTQTSEASSVAPRFRTVSSWVRQQTKRKAEDVPEQGYGLMVPDGEVPRMVQHHVVRPEGVGFKK